MSDTLSSFNLSTGFGIDIGGSGIKGALVDLNTGEFIGERIRIETPQPATPEAVASTVAELVEQAGWKGSLGITVPAVVKNGIAKSAANISPEWIDTDVAQLFGSVLGSERSITVLNDADAAGIAEVTYGDERARQGSALLLTLGTGIGSAFLCDGVLFPNTELGHFPYANTVAEKWAASSVRDREDLSYKEWAYRLNGVLHVFEELFNPHTFILGGGISKKAEKWIPYLTVDTPVVPAQLRNRAGIVGAALAAEQSTRS